MVSPPARPPPAPDAADTNALPGILCMSGGALALSVNDMAVKSLSGTYALHQVILLRSLIGIAFVVFVILVSGTGLRQLVTVRPGAHLVRVSFIVLSNLTFYLGLSVLPLADGVAIAFISPLLVTALSALVLGERVPPRLWLTLFVGLLGVVVMVRPGAGVIRPEALLVALSAASYACAHLMTRRMKTTESATTLAFYGQLGFVVVSTAFGVIVGDGHLAQATGGPLDFLFRPWLWPPAQDWPAFLATGVAVAAAGILLAQAYRLCRVAVVAPFEYVAMPMAIFWGVVVFGRWPSPWAWLGIALICGAGLLALYERRS